MTRIPQGIECPTCPDGCSERWPIPPGRAPFRAAAVAGRTPPGSPLEADTQPPGRDWDPGPADMLQGEYPR